ncbi:MAG TPA: hypothetical protein VFA75_04940 [Nevskia sp.]|nr:hypothetical protein [Nevskia sp.]
MKTIPRGIPSKSILAGAALLLGAGFAPAQAGPTAADLFVGAVLVSSPVFPAAAPAERWDGRGDAGESFVNAVLLPRTAAAGTSDDGRPRQSDAAALFVDAVLKPQAGG